MLLSNNVSKKICVDFPTIHVCFSLNNKYSFLRKEEIFKAESSLLPELCFAVVYLMCGFDRHILSKFECTWTASYSLLIYVFDE